MKLVTWIFFISGLIAGIAMLAFGLAALGAGLVGWEADLTAFGLVITLLGWVLLRESIPRHRKMMAALDGDPEAAMALEADQRWDCKWTGRINGPLVCIVSLLMAFASLAARDLIIWSRLALCVFSLAGFVLCLRWTVRCWRS